MTRMLRTLAVASLLFILPSLALIDLESFTFPTSLIPRINVTQAPIAPRLRSFDSVERVAVDPGPVRSNIRLLEFILRRMEFRYRDLVPSSRSLTFRLNL